jgi:hypothetical protein
VKQAGQGDAVHHVLATRALGPSLRQRARALAKAARDRFAALGEKGREGRLEVVAWLVANPQGSHIGLSNEVCFDS